MPEPLLLAAGYVIGRLRPWRRLSHWADRRMREDGHWWLATGLRQLPATAAYLATWPRASARAWRQRCSETRNNPTEEP